MGTIRIDATIELTDEQANRLQEITKWFNRGSEGLAAFSGLKPITPQEYLAILMPAFIDQIYESESKIWEDS